MDAGQKQFALVLAFVIVGVACIVAAQFVDGVDSKVELVGAGMYLLGVAKKRPWDHAADLHPADVEKRLAPATVPVEEVQS